MVAASWRRGAHKYKIYTWLVANGNYFKSTRDVNRYRDGNDNSLPWERFTMLNLDFSSVPSREPLEEGMYTLQIAKVEEGTSSTGNPMLKVEYDVQGVEGNRKLWDNYVLIDKCLWKVKELFTALGIDTSEVVTMDVNELVGLQVNAKIIQEEYNGDTVNRVKKVYPAA